MKTISEERLKKEFKRTEEVLKEVKISKNLSEEQKSAAEECLDTAQRYYKDAKYFESKGDFASAFGALNYAFGWLDAGLKLNVFVNKHY